MTKREVIDKIQSIYDKVSELEDRLADLANNASHIMRLIEEIPDEEDELP